MVLWWASELNLQVSAALYNAREQTRTTYCLFYLLDSSRGLGSRAAGLFADHIAAKEMRKWKAWFSMKASRHGWLAEKVACSWSTSIRQMLGRGDHHSTGELAAFQSRGLNCILHRSDVSGMEARLSSFTTSGRPWRPTQYRIYASVHPPARVSHRARCSITQVPENGGPGCRSTA